MVDDEPLVRRAIVRELGRVFEVAEASSYTDAVDHLERGPKIAAVVSDLHLAGPEEGLLILASVREIAPGCVRILVSASLDRVAGRVPRGVIPIAKPWRRGEILAAIEQALRSSLAK